jgi:DNA-binding IclR family transcriptional regulator
VNDEDAPEMQVKLPGDRRNLAKSATRALNVLEHFAELKRPLRATEISHFFGWHSSSTDQLLKTMVDSGYLIFEASRKLYRPSPRLVRFGAWLASDYYGGERLRSLLNLLHTRSGEIVTLAVRQDQHMQLVDVVQPVGGPIALEKGLKVPLVGSALGGAYLATHCDAEVERIIGYIDRHRGGPSRCPAILAEVHAIRESGFASGGIAFDSDLRSLAIALPPCDAGVGLVLGFAGPQARLNGHDAELAAVMRRCIAETLLS